MLGVEPGDEFTEKEAGKHAEEGKDGWWGAEGADAEQEAAPEDQQHRIGDSEGQLKPR